MSEALQLELIPAWHTRWVPDRSGARAYTIMVRSPHDPERAPRQKGSDKAPHKTLRKNDPEAWRAGIERLLSDGKQRTFNAICVELSGLTADICGGEMPEDVLWQMVEAGRVEFTTIIPIMFRIVKEAA